MAVTRRDKAATVQLCSLLAALMELFRLPRENAAGYYKRGHYRKKTTQVESLACGVPIAPTPLHKGYRY
jgi:hypothetical protein